MNSQVRLILRRAAAVTGTTVERIRGRCRDDDTVTARITVATLIERFMALADDEIAGVVNRDRTAVGHYRQKLASWDASDPRAMRIEQLAQELAPLLAPDAALEGLFDRIRLAWAARPLAVEEAVDALATALQSDAATRARPTGRLLARHQVAAHQAPALEQRSA
jgi:hypothetical protein